jgi:hypothetical protein
LCFGKKSLKGVVQSVQRAVNNVLRYTNKYLKKNLYSLSNTIEKINNLKISYQVLSLCPKSLRSKVVGWLVSEWMGVKHVLRYLLLKEVQKSCEEGFRYLCNVVKTISINTPQGWIS